MKLQEIYLNMEYKLLKKIVVLFIHFVIAIWLLLLTKATIGNEGWFLDVEAFISVLLWHST